MGEPDLTGKMLLVIGLFAAIAVLSGMCGCAAPGVRYWEEPCEELAKNLGLNAPESDGEHAWLRCKPQQTLELVVLDNEAIGVCRCPKDYLIDAGTP